MVRAGFLVFCLTLGLSALIGGALLVGSETPDTNVLQDAGLGMCAEHPCYFGITPGITTWEEAKQIGLAQGGLLSAPNNVDYLVTLPKSTLIADIFASADNERVNYIELRMGLNGVPLGDIMRHYGTPCKYSSPESMLRHEYLFIYPYMQIYIPTSNGTVNPNSIVTIVELMNPSITKLSSPYNLCTVNDNDPKWQGLLSFSHVTALLQRQ
ncbi:MAG TPA: hypothetical protein VKQ72_00895 [Aggregatilineales bacterium]|nr:hypothetical protein [Aggregatilineales bacterium]